MFSNDRSEIREVFFAAWRKHMQHLPVEPLESQLIDVMVMHPEYHTILNNPCDYAGEDFGANNPFLHMGLHLALREQVSTDRPSGIKLIYAKQCEKEGDVLSAEHKMIECLAEVLWEAQQKQAMPDEKLYLESLRKLL